MQGVGPEVNHDPFQRLALAIDLELDLGPQLVLDFLRQNSVFSDQLIDVQLLGVDLVRAVEGLLQYFND